MMYRIKTKVFADDEEQALVKEHLDLGEVAQYINAAIFSVASDNRHKMDIENFIIETMEAK